MSNSDKIILDLCGGSGSWSKPYKDAGYTVHNITLPEHDILLVVLGEDILTFPRKGSPQPLEIPIVAIHGILAAPPCTEFSVAKTTSPRDFKKGIKTVQACLEIVWHVRARTTLDWWALENPTGLLRYFLGNPPYSFKQWWFGADRSKPTDLWGRFTLPRRLYQQEPIYLQKTNDGFRKRDGVRLKNRNAPWYANATPAQRAITPPEFAMAFFKANP